MSCWLIQPDGGMAMSNGQADKETSLGVAQKSPQLGATSGVRPIDPSRAGITQAHTRPTSLNPDLEVSELGSLMGSAGYNTGMIGHGGRSWAEGGGGADGGTEGGGNADGGAGQGDSGGLTTVGSGSPEDSDLRETMDQKPAGPTTINVPKPEGGKIRYWLRAGATSAHRTP